MSLPDISFESIRPFDGSRHAAFEELCSQLASLEPAPAGARFHRKGRGADAGVECYLKRADETEVGWQAKYLFRWDAGLAAQLDESIRTALEKHPRLTEYVVCLPFDLSDSRTGKGKSARAKWDDWCMKWKGRAAGGRRGLEITLWGKSELSVRLAKDDSAYSGRLLYWFGKEALTVEWLEEQFEKVKASLGTRYTPATNVELPIRQDFLAFARDPWLQKQVDTLFLRVTEEGQSAVDAIRDAGADKSLSEPLATSIKAVTALLGVEPIEPDQLFPTSDWCSATSSCCQLARDALRWAYNLPRSEPKKSGIERERWAQHCLHRLIEVLEELRGAVTSSCWRLVNAKAVLLQGPAGIGKSHLLADIVEHQIHEGRPALLILGSAFTDDEPWRQILTQLDRPPTEQIKHFLGCMDAAAQASGTRALICIDALNERNGIDVWPHRLAAFLKTVEDFLRVGVVLSCRSTYVPYVIPDNLDENQLLRAEHGGFGANGGEAAKIYLGKRGIIRPGAPNLVPEFENPLFLRTCCDFLEKQGRTELPRGLRGITSIFEFYHNAVTLSLNRRMKLDPRLDIVPRAISGLAQIMAKCGKGYVAKGEAVDLFESICLSGGALERSLLSQLEAEGLLVVEPVPEDDGLSVEMVRFTFERFSDHAIAKRLFDDNLDVVDVARSFRPGRPLYEYVFGEGNYEHAGIIEAMAIQLPERTGVEILDVGDGWLWTVRSAFLESLLWREQSYFTDRTFELAKHAMQGDELNDLLISVSTEPTNKFNARFIHKQLVKMSMPKRDASWSIYLAERGFEGPIETVISWSIHNGREHIEEDRAELTAIVLFWFLTTSHREVRDKATKALACVLSRRLPLAARMVRDFSSVNDTYAVERLLAGCYGAVLQGGNERGLHDLARAVFDTVFASGRPPPNALLRDHAHGIIEYAAWCGVSGGVFDVKRTRPPHRSPWPIEPVPDELIESYTETRGDRHLSDTIVLSTVMDGDFARYQIDNKVRNWSPARLGVTSLPNWSDIYKAWKKDFSANISAEQSQVLHEYVSAAEAVAGKGSHAETPETRRLAAAESALKRTLSTDQWEDFRIRARKYIRAQMFSEWRWDQLATFDSGWARRWICKRAHELGWTSARFGRFDSRLRSHGRHDHEVERVGKKYQWLALHELVARMSDNLAKIDDVWEREEDKPGMYRSARQIGLRDIDPSLLVTATHYDGWREWGRTWWVPFSPELRAASPHESRAWLESDSDIINDSALVDLCNPKTRRRWLVVGGFASWRGSGVRDGRREMQRETWFRLNCFVVRRRDRTAAIEGLKGKILTDPNSLPTIDLYGDFYLGEYPWHPEVRNLGLWVPKNDWHAIPVSSCPATACYTCERGSYDYSIDRTVSVQMPAPWLADAMGLRLASGRSPMYVNSAGRDIFYDPSIVEAGPAAALIDREAFLQMLDHRELSAIWVIAGEKSIYGGRRAGVGFGGRVLHTAIYYLDGNDFTRHFHQEWQHPSKEQIREFFGDAPVPPGIPVREELP